MENLYEAIYDSLAKQNYVAAKEYIEKLQSCDSEEAARLMVSLYIEQGDTQGAGRAWEQLNTVVPDDFYTRFLHARILFMEERYLSAYKELKQITIPEDKRQGYGEKIANLMGQCCRILGKTREAASSYKQAAEWATEPELKALEYSNYLFNLHYSGNYSNEFLHQAAVGFNRFFKGCKSFIHQRKKKEGEILRIGYLSSDFRRHVVLCFCYALLTNYDRKQFEVFLYMLGEEDRYSQLLKKQVTGWRNLHGMPFREAARVIYEDEVDILVDLAGHTKGNGLSIMAYKPSPIQLSGIGYFASTGLKEMDYFLGDVYLDGEKGEQGQCQFHEKLIVLPHSHFCYCPFRSVPLPSQSSWQRKGFVTFGSFNNFAKVTDEVLAVWGQILTIVPDSHLLLKAAVFDGGEMETYTKARLQKAGLPMARVECRGISEDYLSEYEDMDIALDTFPYPGGGTSCDALYMGVPLITLVGRNHGERFGYSLLMNLGLGELATFSSTEYVERAVMLAQSKEVLLSLQQNLRRLMEKSPLMDRALYLQDVQSAYQKMARTYWGIPQVLSYREKMQEKNLIDQIIYALDNADTSKAQASLCKLKVHDAMYYYLCSELSALQVDFSHSDDFCRRALGMPQGNGQWLWGAVYHRLAENAKQIGKREVAAEYYLQSSQYKEMAQGKAADYSNYLFNLHYSSFHAIEMLEAAKGYGELFVGVKQYRHTRRFSRKKLRIGYISPDFCRHVVAGFSQAFFRAYNRDKYEVFAYADCEPDEVTRQMMQYSVNWRQINGLTTIAKADLIYQDEIDILVDLSGHTGHSALPVLAYKPAPVQISGIGYFATTGLAAVDYYLTDTYTALPGEENFFTECLLRLPHSHFCYTPLSDKPPISISAPCRVNGYVTLGTMNQFDKVTDEMLTLWAEIMKKLPEARLLLKSGAFDKNYRRESAGARLLQAGIPLERTKLLGYTEDFWQFYGQIDIALDTYPYPGGGSTCDALYMGVPVISLYGEHHHQRFGYSLLTNAGLGELAVGSGDAYVRYVVALGSNMNLLINLHRTIAGSFRRSAVMDEALYMRELEQIYQQVGR